MGLLNSLFLVSVLASLVFPALSTTERGGRYKKLLRDKSGQSRALVDQLNPVLLGRK